MKIYVVIPTYNEAENLPLMANSLFELAIDNLNLLIVDDNSPDGTGEIAESLKDKFPTRVSVLHREGKQGLGTAYLQGFDHCLKKGAEAIVQMDADFSHNPGIVTSLLEQLKEYDLVIGSRYVTGGSLDDNWAAWRKSLSSFGNIYARWILRLPIKDVTGGFRAWRRETLLGIPLARVKSQGYAFQVEMAYIAYALGYRIREIPIYFAERERGDSKMSLGIQAEAAKRVWSILYEYRDLKK
ncbi:MAG: polyprenol monophosphomannose synthase [Chloroflexota bacterium]|nr:MAG: polyprenol monophosphomannose synthase [Chloroflexota bacterium]